MKKYRIDIRNGDFWNTTGSVIEGREKAQATANEIAKRSGFQTRLVEVK